MSQIFYCDNVFLKLQINIVPIKYVCTYLQIALRCRTSLTSGCALYLEVSKCKRMCVGCDGEPSLVLILKWGGELTPAGRIQAEELGRMFRCMYPGGQGRHIAGTARLTKHNVVL